MKVSKWWKRIAFSLATCGLLAPGTAWAVNIPLIDPSFEAFVVPTTGPTAGYAYAGNTANPHYRPTSPWVSRLDDGVFTDGNTHASNWIYSAAYAELTNTNYQSDGVTPSASNPDMVSQGHRASPRTGNQAMHGRGFLNAQEITAVFEPGKTYTFSIYAQGDSNAEYYPSLPAPIGWQSRVFLYIFDATVSLHTPGGPFNYDDPNFQTALTHDPAEYLSTPFAHDRFAPTEPIPPSGPATHPGNFINRPLNANAAQSKAAWTQISISWFVAPGSPEEGHPIGVAFKVGSDGAVDDASLSSSGILGDFNGDQALDVQDWHTLRAHLLTDVTGTPTEQYHLGNMTGLGTIDQLDFIAFKNAYIQTHSLAAFEAMVSGVPEPGAVTLVVSAAGFWLVRRRRQSVN